MPAPLISGVQGTVSGYLHGGYPPCSFISGHLHPGYPGCRWQYRGYALYLLGIPEPPLWGVQVESLLAAPPICGVHMYTAGQVGRGVMQSA